MSNAGDIKGDTVLVRSVPIGISQFRKGVIAPTDTTIGTTPTVPALAFSTTTQLVTFSANMPQRWDKTKNCTLYLIWALSVAETNGDTLDITLDYVAPKKETTGAGPGKTSTQKTGQVTVTTANGLAVGDVYEMAIPILQNDASNGFSDGDKTVGFIFEFRLTNTTGVGAANLVSGRLAYEAIY